MALLEVHEHAVCGIATHSYAHLDGTVHKDAVSFADVTSVFFKSEFIKLLIKNIATIVIIDTIYAYIFSLLKTKNKFFKIKTSSNNLYLIILLSLKKNTIFCIH